eukprot:scaffold21321_cov66-Phaeocystis_antarctica.AAC.3
MQSVRGNDRACGAAVGVRSLQIRRVTRAWASTLQTKLSPRVLKCDLPSSEFCPHWVPKLPASGQGQAQIKRCPYYKY